MGGRKTEEQEPEVQEITINDFKILDYYYVPKVDKVTGEKYMSFECPLAVLLGRRRSGKSVKLISLLSECRDMFGTAYLFSPTAFGTGVFGTIFKHAFCYRQPTEGILKAIQMLQDFLKERAPSFLTRKDLICLIVLDDCGSLAFMKTGFLAELACNCRNSNISLWFTLQNFNQVTPVVRENCDIFLTNLTSNISIQKKMFTEFFSCFGTLECFVAALEHCAQKFGSMVWRNAGEFDDIEHSVFRYRCSNTNANSFSLDVPLQGLIQELFGKTEAEKAEDALKELNTMAEKMSKLSGAEAEVDEDMELDPDEEDLVGLQNGEEGESNLVAGGEDENEPGSDSDAAAPKKKKKPAAKKAPAKDKPKKKIKSNVVKGKAGKAGVVFATMPIEAH